MAARNEEEMKEWVEAFKVSVLVAYLQPGPHALDEQAPYFASGSVLLIGNVFV